MYQTSFWGIILKKALSPLIFPEIMGGNEWKMLVKADPAGIYEKKNIRQSFSLWKHSKAILHNVKLIMRKEICTY